MSYKSIAARNAAQVCYRFVHRLRLNEKAMLKGRKTRAVTKEFMIELKTNRPCLDCRSVFPWYVMQFDHRNPADKVGPISQMARTSCTLEYLMKEIAKCDLVCANCHCMRTYKQRLEGKFK